MEQNFKAKQFNKTQALIYWNEFSSLTVLSAGFAPTYLPIEAQGGSQKTHLDDSSFQESPLVGFGEDDKVRKQFRKVGEPVIIKKGIHQLSFKKLPNVEFLSCANTIRSLSWVQAWNIDLGPRSISIYLNVIWPNTI